MGEDVAYPCRVLAVAIARVGPLVAALAVPGAAHRICLGAHQRLGEGLHHRAQQIRARLRDLLLQPVTSILGPAVIAWLLIIESLDGLNENHAVAASPHDAMLTSGNIEHHISGHNPRPAQFTRVRACSLTCCTNAREPG